MYLLYLVGFQGESSDGGRSSEAIETGVSYMGIYKKVTTMTKGHPGRNVASSGVSGGPLISSASREAPRAAREPLSTEYGVGAQGSTGSIRATMPRLCRLGKMKSRRKVRSAEGLLKDKQVLGGGAKKMTLQCDTKGIASWYCINMARIITLPTVEGCQGDCARKTHHQVVVYQ